MSIPDGYNAELPLGEDNSNNSFSSLNVTANRDGSLLERAEDLAEQSRRCVVLGQAAASLTGTAMKFTVSGMVAIKHIGMLITTALPAGANTLKFQFTPTGGAATDLCAATDTASAAKNQFFAVDGVKATALVKTTDPGIVVFANEHMPIILGPGQISTVYSAGPPATGAATLYVEYEPLSPGSTITALT